MDEKLKDAETGAIVGSAAEVDALVGGVDL